VNHGFDPARGKDAVEGSGIGKVADRQFSRSVNSLTVAAAEIVNDSDAET